MNTKIALSGLSILSALALMGGATFAFFESTSTSVGNTFATGTVNLLVDDVNESTPSGTVTQSISATNFAPGDITTGFISLHNGGSIPLAEVEMTADTTESADPGTNSDLKDVLQLSVLLDDTTPDSTCSGGTNYTSTIDTQVGDGLSPLTLAEFDNTADQFDAFLTGTGLAAGATRNVCFTVTFDPLAGNIYQGDAASTTFTFTGNQNASQ